MMVDAVILPMGPLADETIDSIVTRALAAGLVACNCITGPFRVAFFKPRHVPAGWSKIGLAIKEAQRA